MSFENYSGFGSCSKQMHTFPFAYAVVQEIDGEF